MVDLIFTTLWGIAMVAFFINLRAMFTGVAEVRDWKPIAARESSVSGHGGADPAAT